VKRKIVRKFWKKGEKKKITGENFEKKENR
jgi:hypothetical protein